MDVNESAWKMPASAAADAAPPQPRGKTKAGAKGRTRHTPGACPDLSRSGRTGR